MTGTVASLRFRFYRVNVTKSQKDEKKEESAYRLDGLDLLHDFLVTRTGLFVDFSSML